MSAAPGRPGPILRVTLSCLEELLRFISEMMIEIGSKKQKDATIVSIKGRMDALSSPDFERHLEALMETGVKNFILNLEELNYISSAGLRSILIIAKKLKEKEGRISLACLTKAVKEIFVVSGFISLFPIYDSLDLALSES